MKIIEWTFDQFVYMEYVEVLIPYIDTHFEEGDFHFLQDNHSSHKTHAVQK